MNALTTRRWLPHIRVATEDPINQGRGISRFRFRISLATKPYPLAPANGFTLIEILVVLVIIGVLALAVTIGVASAGGERQLTREAERFQALVAYACTRAELSGREIGIRVDARGYAFTMLGLDGWAAEEQQGELRPRAWVRGLGVELLRDGSELRFSGDAAALPQIICFSSGELSPFVLRLVLGDVTARYELKGRGDGRIELNRAERQQ